MTKLAKVIAQRDELLAALTGKVRAAFPGAKVVG